MGIGFTIDSPLKLAHFGIDSVISIVDDMVIEQMREFYCNKYEIEYHEIDKKQEDFRAKRITEYLNLINQKVNKNFENLKQQDFDEDNDLNKYFQMLPESSDLKIKYNQFKETTDDELKQKIKEQLISEMKCGSSDVNIMAKVDTVNYDKKGNQLPDIYNDAMSALRGFANSELNSSIVLSAGLNPRLYAYFEEFKDFFPDENGEVKKKIILKVSDFRSANIQGKMLAKRGLCVSEFRIESGLNCGGHAFATEGKLMGPILEELKENKEKLSLELFEISQNALSEKGWKLYEKRPEIKFTAQGGIGTSSESQFIREFYQLDSAGWGSPFLLVPEATNVDDETLVRLANAKKDDYYLSDASPLGVPFNNLRNTSNQKLIEERVEKNRPGSPCLKKYLEFNNEFTEKNICTASRQYQNLKLKELEQTTSSPEEYERQSKKIIEKECLCEGLAVPALLVNKATKAKQLKAVSICPGPNLAYFSGTFSLKQMVDHIYGRISILNQLNREHVFINELEMYVDYLKNEIQKSTEDITSRQLKYFEKFRESLFDGIVYYKDLFKQKATVTEEYRIRAAELLEKWEQQLKQINMPVVPVCS